MAEAAPGRWAAPAATLAAGVLCAVVAGLRLGAPGVVSALLATAVVAAFFRSGLLPLALAGERAERGGLALLVLLTNYALRLVLVLLVLAAAAARGWVDRGAVGLALVVCTLVWTTASAVALTRAPH